MVLRVQPLPEIMTKKIDNVCSQNVVKYAPKCTIFKQKFKKKFSTPACGLRPLVFSVPILKFSPKCNSWLRPCMVWCKTEKSDNRRTGTDKQNWVCRAVCISAGQRHDDHRTVCVCVCVCGVWHEFLIRRRRKDASTCRHKQSRHATWRNNDVWKWRFAWRPPRHATRRSPPNQGNAMAYPAADRPLFLPFLFLRSSFLFFSALCLHPHSCAERQKIIINVNKRC